MFGLRYYQPATVRWTQQDPLAGSLFDPSSGNRYAYANANPVNLVDPTGADTIDCAFALTAGFMGNVIGIAGIAGGVLTGWTGIGIVAVIAGGVTIQLTDATLAYVIYKGVCH